MIILKEFFSDFVKIKRTPIILLCLLLPIIITILFLIYFVSGGYHTVPDIRLYFIMLQICYPIFISIVVTLFINLDRNINGIQNALGLAASRISVYLGKVIFLLFLSVTSIIVCELSFFVGVEFFLNINVINYVSYLHIFLVFLFSSVFLCLLHIPVSFQFGSSISVLLGIFGTIFAGYFENAIGDKLWPIIPWEWGVRFLKNHFNDLDKLNLGGIIGGVTITLAVLLLSILWYSRWEGKVVQE